MLSKELEFTLNNAFKEARNRRFEFMTVEHLLLALIDNPTAAQVLRACGGDLDTLRDELDSFVDENTPLLDENDTRETQPTLGFQRVLQRAVFHVQSSGKKEVTGANVLVAIFGEQDSQTVYLLNKQNITRLDVVNYISHGIAKNSQDDPEESEENAAEFGGEEGEADAKPLDKYATNLNAKAIAGEIDPLIGREFEVERASQVLCRRRKNNPLLVGEAGVGKTAIAEGLASRYINDRFLPDKAIDVIDEAGANHRVKGAAAKGKKQITVKDIEAIVAKIARIPEKSVSSTDMDKLKTLARDLRMLVFGQDEAIDALGAAIKMSRSGLGPQDKPIGSFMFAGPTGLIGAPPGYVGFDQGGLLTDSVIQNPHAVVLLDEIEKAHPDVFNLLLQVMDHGTLTDNNGRKADFRNIILIMTTNAGAESLSRTTMGFTQQDHSSDGAEAVNKLFTPEFRNRLDAIIQFKALDKSIILNVVDKFIIELEAQLEEKNVAIDFNDEAKAWLAEHGFDERMGARPMARLISENVKKPLADEILFGKLSRGGRVRVILDEKGDLAFEFESKESKEATV